MDNFFVLSNSNLIRFLSKLILIIKCFIPQNFVLYFLIWIDTLQISLYQVISKHFFIPHATHLIVRIQCRVQPHCMYIYLQLKELFMLSDTPHQQIMLLSFHPPQRDIRDRHRLHKHTRYRTHFYRVVTLKANGWPTRDDFSKMTGFKGASNGPWSTDASSNIQRLMYSGGKRYSLDSTGDDAQLHAAQVAFFTGDGFMCFDPGCVIMLPLFCRGPGDRLFYFPASAIVCYRVWQLV